MSEERGEWWGLRWTLFSVSMERVGSGPWELKASVLEKGIEQVLQELSVTLKSESTSLVVGLGRGSCFYKRGTGGGPLFL